MLKKGSMIKYTGSKHGILVIGDEYKVAEVFPEGGIRVYIKTGFAGIPDDSFEVIKD